MFEKFEQQNVATLLLLTNFLNKVREYVSFLKTTSCKKLGSFYALEFLAAVILNNESCNCCC